MLCAEDHIIKGASLAVTIAAPRQRRFFGGPPNNDFEGPSTNNFRGTPNNRFGGPPTNDFEGHNNFRGPPMNRFGGPQANRFGGPQANDGPVNRFDNRLNGRLSAPCNNGNGMCNVFKVLENY